MDISVRVQFPDNITPHSVVGWRCLHEAEGGYDSDDRGMPEVRPSFNAPPVPFTKEMQLLSWNMNTYNLLFTRWNWRVVYGNGTALTNQNGFGDANDPRADYVNNRDIGKPLPRLMKAIIFGGMFIRGNVVGDTLQCVPGTHAIDANKPIPSIETVFRNNWYMVATTQSYGKISHFPQGHGKPVYIPYILKDTVTYPLSWFTKWSDNVLPDPLKIYLTK